jgi:hypothetical protein
VSYQVITADLTPQQYQQDSDRFILGSLIFLAVCVVLVFVVILKYASGASEREAKRVRAALEAEDRRRYALEQSWVDTDEWPLTHYDVYSSAWELAQDLARLKAMGYDVDWQEHLEQGVAVTYSLSPAYEQSRKRSRHRGRHDDEEDEGAY